MNPELSAIEARVIACLIEKQVTTPEQYPLSLNALQNACNQKSNRDPLMQLSEGEVQTTLDALVRRHLVLERSGFGSRVPKYQQRLCNTEFSTLQLTTQERAVLCELLLRGPQTVGELRTRAARMASFADAAEVESTLEALMQRTSGALVHRLAREAGRREVRYTQLLGPAPAESPGEAAADVYRSPAAESSRRTADATDSADPHDPAGASPWALALQARVRELEGEVARLSGELEELRGRLPTL